MVKHFNKYLTVCQARRPDPVATRAGAPQDDSSDRNLGRLKRDASRRLIFCPASIGSIGTCGLHVLLPAAALTGHSPVPLAVVLLGLCLVALLALRPIGRIALQAEPKVPPAMSEPTR